MNRRPPPAKPPECRRCAKPMTQTHSRYDFACFDCGDQVDFTASEAGVWREASQKTRDRLLRDAGRATVAAGGSGT